MADLRPMPIMTDSFLANTIHLTTHEFGACSLLLIAMWRAGGSLPADDKHLCRMAHLTAAQWRRVKPVLMPFFNEGKKDGELSFSATAAAMLVPSKRQSIPQSWKDAVIERDGAACNYCGVADQPLQMDHIIPISRGGLHHPSNLTPACSPCNRSKGALLIEEWMPQS